tara:strand:- start:245 stop:508 length:264 start_codon:yes stop_codon:yes gene_type:complete
LGNKATLNQNQLGSRLTKASNDLDKIMRDLQRDCKPYWKFTELVTELIDISYCAEQTKKNHKRVLAARDKKIEHLESALRGEQKKNG